VVTMTRGRQKLEAQRKGALKKEEQAKKGSQMEHRMKAMKLQCELCKILLTHENQIQQHYDSKHPGKDPQVVEVSTS